MYKKEIKQFKHLTFSDKFITICGYVGIVLFVLAIIIPLIYIVIASFMDPNELNNNGITFNFSKWSLDGYKRIFKDDMLLRGFVNSIFYSTSFAVISVFATLLAAYPLSRPDFVGKRLITTLYVITMFFGGGLMPTYLLIDSLKMINTPWAIILPGAINVWNIILARTYFQSLPKELREASAIDGASDITHFIKIILPVCKPIIAVLLLYQFVAQWNSYFDAMIYLDDSKLQPLQLVIRSILIQNTPRPGMIADVQSTAAMAKIAELLKYSTIVVSSLPLLVMYPFFQKYFDKGIMAGSVKG
ncbi:carbohydrate ABC transporter permease [Clostridium beijerinckii]|uniref:Aldouronate transport system permease protein n=1 Tax=Clostridium beijerinckii TaxID=1520 RepID=A0AAE5H3M8_CLOBE|nr:carbohydrate ABC transporter permease [Clostridium beijerinckii]NSB13423.1 putative aldouronate transport system permease protein [Clostridium beijerinckii]OOM23980.1 inner membrane ABC transporter permease protein YcjP [Clostridium beijerinckii]